MADYTIRLTDRLEALLDWYLSYRAIPQTKTEWIEGQAAEIARAIELQRRDYDLQQILSAYNALGEDQQAATVPAIYGILDPAGQEIILAYAALTPEAQATFVRDVRGWLGLPPL